jgi:peptidyl-prolyl isomerase G (cyclophilin G)
MCTSAHLSTRAAANSRVFGRVVSGMEHIRSIGSLPTDGRDRPHSPVIVSHAGELELRRPAAPSASRSQSRSVSPRKRRSKYSDDSDSEEEERRRRRRARKEREREEREERRRERRERRERRDGSEKQERKERRRRSVSETISELDARLEAEEKARLEAERTAKEAEAKARRERELQAVRESGGIVYKGESWFLVDMGDDGVGGPLDLVGEEGGGGAMKPSGPRSAAPAMGTAVQPLTSGIALGSLYTPRSCAS